jgi:hypothetical protein
MLPLSAPLIFSGKVNQPKCMDILCQWGADVNARDYKDNTVLHYLAKKQMSTQPSAIHEYKLKRSAFGTREEEKDYKKFARLYVAAIKKAKQMEDDKINIYMGSEHESDAASDGSEQEKEGAKKEDLADDESDEYDDEAYMDDMSEKQILKLLNARAKAEAETFDAEGCLKVLNKIHRDDLLHIFQNEDKNIETYVDIATEAIYDLESDSKVLVLSQLILNIVDIAYLQLKFLEPYEKLLLSSKYVPQMELTSKELLQRNVLDHQDFSELMMYSTVS